MCVCDIWVLLYYLVCHVDSSVFSLRLHTVTTVREKSLGRAFSSLVRLWGPCDAFFSTHCRAMIVLLSMRMLCLLQEIWL
uniref:Putative secreted protein n=1 Tax=Amblyomma cajennense TaxID=34607 RepID=A0A023FBN2_AMBCJ